MQSRFALAASLLATVAPEIALPRPAAAAEPPSPRLAAALTAKPATADPMPETPLDTAERAAVVEQLARLLAARYVFPDVAARYAAMLRENLAKGAYDGIADPDALGKQVTADLQALSPDLHLRLATAKAFGAKRRAVESGGVGPRPSALEAKMIGDVAYLKFNFF